MKKENIYRQFLVYSLVLCILAFLLSGCGSSANENYDNQRQNEPRPEPATEQQAEQALNSYNFVDIISHDTDWENLIDTFTYKGSTGYGHMVSETTGVIAFKFDSSANEWQRYKEGDSQLSYSENWEDLNGEWICAENISKNESVDFRIKVTSFDGETLDCEFTFEGNYYLDRTHELNEFGLYMMSPAEDFWGDAPHGINYIGIIDSDDDPFGTQYGIVLDKDDGVLLWVIPRGGYVYLKKLYCEKTEAYSPDNYAPTEENTNIIPFVGNTWGEPIEIGGWILHPQVFDTPIENCVSFTLNFQIGTSTPGGGPYGYWATSIKDSTGTWRTVKEFLAEDDNPMIINIDLQNPTTIFEICCYRLTDEESPYQEFPFNACDFVIN